MRVTPALLLQGSRCRFVSAGEKWMESEKKTRRPPRCPRLPDPAAASAPCPRRRFRAVPLFCFCIRFGDSFKDVNTPRHSHLEPAQPQLLTVGADICLIRCSFVFVNTLSSFRSQINMILHLSFQMLPSSHMAGQISDFTDTHTGSHTIGTTCIETQR